MPREKPYILNMDAKVAHRRAALTESCNTDQIVRRRNATLVPSKYRRCEHCHASYTAESPYSESNAGFSESQP